MREHDERRLRALLRDEAETHTPDRDAMLHRVLNARVAPHRRPVLLRLRPLAAAAGVVAVLGASIAGARLAGSDPADPVAGPSASPSPSLSPSPSVSPSPARPPRASVSKGSASRSAAGKDRFLSSRAKMNATANLGWSEGNMLLTISEPVTALEVTITVVKTAGVTSSGKWTTIPEPMMTNTVTERGDEVVFRFVLKPGGYLEPREYTFASQFFHASGERSTDRDTYRVKATADGTTAEVSGTF